MSDEAAAFAWRGSRAPRLPAWADRFAASLAVRAAWPLDYARQDCVRLVAATVLAVTGVDWFAPRAPTLPGDVGPVDDPALPDWSDAWSAIAALNAEAGLEALLDRRLERLSPARAVRADVGLVSVGGALVCVAVAADGLVGVSARGLTPAPRAALLRAYRVGDR